MINILITAAGTGTAFSYATAIAKNFSDVVLYTADTNSSDLVTSSLFAKEHMVLESIYSNEYTSCLEKIITEKGIDFYIPLIDLEILNAYKSKLLNEKMAANSFDFSNNCINKNSYESSFSVKNIKFPRIVLKDKVDNSKLYIAKENGGFGGRATKCLKGEEVKFLSPSYTVYEKIDGVEYTVDCFPIDDEVVTSIRKRVEVKNGVCTKAHIFRNEKLENAAKLFVENYQLKHPFCFQVIEQLGEFYLIDFNPRLGAGSAMSSVNGLDFFSAHLAKLLGADPRKFLNRFHDSCVVTRQYANYLTKVFE